MIAFRVDGIPKAQPRVKARRIGLHAGVYDPGTADGWKALIATAAMPHRPDVPWEGPLCVTIRFYLPRPKCLMRAKDPSGPIWHWKKPDRDNLEKAVLDTLKNLGFYRDDGQACAGAAEKYYCAKTGRPGALVTIDQLPGVDLIGVTTRGNIKEA